MKTIERPTTKMNPQFKELWIIALRSGMFPQAQEVLRCETGFCCLGVLATLVEPMGWFQREAIYDAVGGLEWAHPLQADGEELLSNEALERVGLTYEIQEYLSQLNDDGWSFEDIAKEIETYL